MQQNIKFSNFSNFRSFYMISRVCGIHTHSSNFFTAFSINSLESSAAFLFCFPLTLKALATIEFDLLNHSILITQFMDDFFQKKR